MLIIITEICIGILKISLTVKLPNKRSNLLYMLAMIGILDTQYTPLEHDTNPPDTVWHPDRQELTLDLHPLLGNSSLLKLTGWDVGITWGIATGKETETYTDPFGASPFPIEYFEHDLLNPWVATIPDNNLALLKHYKGNAFGMLMLVNRSRFARELFEQHPVLFWLAFTFAHDHSWQEHQFVTCCQDKRADILKACGFPATPSAVKLLHKINGHYFNRYAYDIIQAIFQLESYSMLNHCQTLSMSMLALITHMPEILYSKFVLNWQDAWSTEVSQLIKDIRRMGRYMPEVDYWGRLIQCRNAESLTAYHDQLVDQLNRNNRLRHDPRVIPNDIVYSSPPLSGNESIVPIRNSSELKTESLEQAHCVASYHADIMAGLYYVYKVLHPERATLGVSILKTKNGKATLRIDQLRGYKNQKVNDVTEKFVLGWFYEHQKLA